jgi:CheY-like chemotaxis protein
VLLVQSDPDNLAMYADFLELHGHLCVRASSTADAFIVAPIADVIVTGIQVPGQSDGTAVIGDGIDFIRRLKVDSRTMRVPAIVLTTNSSTTERARAEQAGCSSFLTKPCLPEYLLSEVRRVATGVE